MSIDVTAAQTDPDYRSWLASRLPADQWDALDDLLDHLLDAWQWLRGDDDTEPDSALAGDALLDAEDALGALIGQLVTP